MKKLLLCGVIAASLGVTTAGATTAAQDFDVKATVTALCQSTDATNPALNFGTYTAFGSAQFPTPTTNIHFQCTRGLLITNVALSKTASTVAGLAYTLGVDAGTKTGGSAATGGTGAGADTWVFVVNGNMPASQAGDSAAATTDTQTLTITF